MSDVKPNYVRPRELHSLNEYCSTGSTPCIPVIALADYNAVVEMRDAFRTSQDVCLTMLEAVQKHRDALSAALDQINVAACYASEEDPGAAKEALLHIGNMARHALKYPQAKS